MYIYLLIFLGFLTACSDHPSDNKEEIKIISLKNTLDDLTPAERHRQYLTLRNNIVARQQALSAGSIDKARAYLLKTLTDSIFPHWYETPWDFNGTTEVPRQGNIACGFFVSTTLQHAGFNIDRVKCGQQASSVFINALCKPGSVKWITKNDTSRLYSHLLAQPDGLYLIGLDYHTGFIQKDGKDLWMIHAAYWPHHKVVKETVQACAHILESKIFVVGNLSGNNSLIKKWMSREYIPIGE